VEPGTKLTTMFPFPATTVGRAGASGNVFGTTSSDGTDGSPSPSRFDANTVHVYVLPFVSPGTVIGDDSPSNEPGAPPFDDKHSAVYPMIANPPSAGATNDTSMPPIPATTVG
jgi:hypothetical protein